MKHKIKRFFQKISLFIAKRILTVERKRLTKTQIEASLIFKKLLSDPETDLLISPISNKYYLKNSEKEILLTLGYMNLSIINHVFGYDVSISTDLQEKLKVLFNEEVEIRRKRMDDEYRKNIRFSLKEVLNQLNYEK